MEGMMDTINGMNEDEMKEKVKSLAKDNFRKGLNCAESVFKAMLDSGLVNYPPETVSMTTGFGGGIGLSGGVCGALAAAVMGIGAVHGRSKLPVENMDEAVSQLYGNPGRYRFFNQLPHKFEQIFGSTQCEVLNKDYSDWYNKDRFRKCMNIVVDTASMAVEFIFQGKREGYIQPFGKNMAGKV